MARIGLERVLVGGALVLLVVLPALVVLGGLVERAVGLGVSAVPLVGALVFATAVALLVDARSRAALRIFAERLPARWDGALSRRPGLCFAWGALAILGIVQMTRLACFVVDPSLTWGSAYPPVDEAVHHACLSAYVQAGDLCRRGVDNVYAEEHYPAFRGGSLGHTERMESSVLNLSAWLEDPYEYPPPFLLISRLRGGAACDVNPLWARGRP